MNILHVKPFTKSALKKANQGTGLTISEYYHDYIFDYLPELDNVDVDSDLRLEVYFGVSIVLIDTDNLLKLFKDAIALYYGFPDYRVCSEIVHKSLVRDGNEFIAFDLTNTGTTDWIPKHKKPEYKEIINAHNKRRRSNEEYRIEENKKNRQRKREMLKDPVKRAEYNKNVREWKRKNQREKTAVQRALDKKNRQQLEFDLDGK